MDEKSLFTDFWSKESKTTSKVLARIPEGSDYRPDPKSRTAREIAWQIVNEEKMIIDALETGTAEWAPPPAPATMKELSETYDRQSAEIVRRLQALPRRTLGRHTRVLRWPTAGITDGVELSVRHRPPPRADHDVSARDGIDRAADIRAQRGRAVTGLLLTVDTKAYSVVSRHHGTPRDS